MYSGRYGDVARRRLEVEYMSFIKDPSPCRYQSSTVIRSSNVVGVKITQKPTLKAFCGQLLLFGNKQSEVDDGRRSLAGLHSTPPPPPPPRRLRPSRRLCRVSPGDAAVFKRSATTRCNIQQTSAEATRCTWKCKCKTLFTAE